MAESLAVDSSSAPADLDRLKILGKRVADLHGSGKSLTEAAVQIVKDKDLNASHVRRVCELANQEAYQRELAKGGDVRNVSFPGGPADPEAVIKASKAQPPARRDLSDYDKAPSKRSDDMKSLLKAVFGKTEARPSEATKTASPVPALRSDLIKAHDHVREKLGSLRLELHDVTALLQQQVRSAYGLDGYPMEKIGHVFRQINPAYADEALEMMEGAVAPLRLSMGKTKTASAGSIPNPDHPLVTTYQRFCKVAQAAKVHAGALQEIERQQAELGGSR